MIALRKLYPPLRRGELTFRFVSDHNGNEEDAGIYAFDRTYENETVLVVGNAHPSKASQTTVGGVAMPTSFPEGTQLRNVYPDDDTADDFTVGAGGRLTVRVPPRGGKLLVRADRVR